MDFEGGLQGAPAGAETMAVDLATVGIVCADVMVRPVDAMPERGKLTLTPTLELHMGGLAGVTAAVYSKLGGSSAFIGAVGCDGFGRYILNTLTGAGVDVSHVRQRSELNTSATVVLVGSDGERTFLHHVGANGSVSPADIDSELFRHVKALHWGGPSVTPHLDGAPMGEVLEQAQTHGVITSMDTCYDGTDTWLPLIEPALPHLDLVMSSLEEAQRYTGQDTPEAIADFYLSYGARAAVIKLGGEGLYVKGGDEAHRLPAHAVTPVDTTGAGDAACAGFLYGYVRGWDLLRCAKLANAVGALTVQCMGGAEGVKRPEDAFALIEAQP